MPWKKQSLIGQRAELVWAALRGRRSLCELCRQFGVSRTTAYKWIKRFRLRGRSGLADASRRPHRSPGRTVRRWVKALVEWRKKRPRWGAKKLHATLRDTHPRARLPAVRTIARWLVREKLVGRKPHRARRGPSLAPQHLTAPRRANEVWTIDFKGWFRTGDRQRCEPLTVRDLFSRYMLGVVLLADRSDAGVRRGLASALCALWAAGGDPRRQWHTLRQHRRVGALALERVVAAPGHSRRVHSACFSAGQRCP